MDLVFLGAPGSGKGTQAQALANRHGLSYLSTGDLLRRLVAEGGSGEPSGSESRALQAKAYMDRGELVPDSLMVEILLSQFDKEPVNGLVLDGFPRNRTQAEILERSMAERGLTLDAALLLEVADHEVERRLTQRSQCQDCGKVFGQAGGHCPECGGNLLVRSDDSLPTIRQRLLVYHEQIDPLVAYYEERGLLRRVNGEGDPAVIALAIEKTLGFG